MNSQDFRNLQEAYLEVYELDEAGPGPLPVRKMDAKVRELKSQFLQSNPGSPEAAKLISRASQIIGTRDRKVVSDSYDLYDIILSHLLDEGTAGDVAARARKLANQKGQTPERKKMYQDLANEAGKRARQDDPTQTVGSSRFEYNQKHGRPLITPEVSQSRSSQGTLGGVTYQRGPKRKPKSQRKYDRQVLSGVRAASEQEKERARKRMGINEDIYDIILSHLLDEGYAETPEAAEVIMVNMSEEWRDDISELYKGKHGQSETEYQAGRSDAGKRVSGDENTGPRHYALGRSARPDAPTKPGEKPKNTPKLANWEKDDIQYRKANLKK